MMICRAAYNQVSVINPNFCSPRNVDLVITKNFWRQGNFIVKNVNGKIVFKIEGSIFSFDRKRVMVDTDGTPVVTLRKKILSPHSPWEVFRGKGKNEKDFIFSARRASILQMETKLVVFVAKNKSEDVYNYTVEGNWLERSCEVYVGDSSSIVAQVHKNFSVNSLFTGKDRFKVTVFPNIDCAFIVALIVILDEIVSQNKQKSSNNQGRTQARTLTRESEK